MGKISVKYYLNKNVKPIIRGSNEFGENVEEYPLYYYITIRRKTIHKPSRINTYLSEKELAEKRHVVWEGRLAEMMDYESSLIKSIAEVFEKDYEAGKVKTAYQVIVNKSFNSKDDYTNNLNAYIEFYLEKVDDLLDREVKATTKELFLDKIPEIRKKLGKLTSILEIKPSSVYDDSGLLIYEEAFGYEKVRGIFAKYIIKLFTNNVSTTTNTAHHAIRQIGLSVFEWLHGDAKDLVWENLYREREKRNKNERNTNVSKLLTITREEYDTEIVPIIDKVCTAEDRVEKAYEAMKRGI